MKGECKRLYELRLKNGFVEAWAGDSLVAILTEEEAVA